MTAVLLPVIIDNAFSDTCADQALFLLGRKNPHLYSIGFMVSRANFTILSILAVLAFSVVVPGQHGVQSNAYQSGGQ